MASSPSQCASGPTIEEEESSSSWERFSRKFKDQPLVPLGAGATTIALLGAARAIRRGNSNEFNIWLRYRVILQGLTIIAALGGSWYYTKQHDITRAALEDERKRQRDLRIQEQEERFSKGSSQSIVHDQDVPKALESASDRESLQVRKAWLKKAIADQARADSKPLRSFASARSPDTTD